MEKGGRDGHGMTANQRQLANLVHRAEAGSQHLAGVPVLLEAPDDVGHRANAVRADVVDMG